MNPELLRNLWLEFSPQRLIATPVILGVAFFLTASTGNGPGHGSITSLAEVIGFFLLVVWGARLAGDAVASEVAARTWDSQRLTPITAWSMTWGKLFGATAFVWYGGAFCLVAIAIDNPSRLGPVELTKHLAITVMSVLLGHAVAMLLGLQALRGRSRAGLVRSTLLQLFGVAAATVPLILRDFLYPISSSGAEQIHWFGYLFLAQDFLLLALAVFLGFALLGLHHLMRLELQLQNLPVAWIAFVLWAMAFVAGLSDTLARTSDFPVWSAQLTTFAVAALLAYATAFTEPKDVVALRRLATAIRERQVRLALHIAPRWGLTLMVAVMVGALLIVQGPVDDFVHDDSPVSGVKALLPGQHRSMLIAMLLYLLRDHAILFGLGLGARNQRGEAAGVLYLFVLWVMLPAFVQALTDDDVALLLFLPAPRLGVEAVLSPLLQAVLAAGFALWAFRRASRAR